MSQPDNARNPQAKVDNRFNESLADEVDELRSSLNSIQSLVSTALILIVVFSTCVNIYLLLQTLSMRSQLHHDAVLSENVTEKIVANMGEFYGRLNDYASKHPEFRAVISKYDHYFKTGSSPAK